MGLLRSVGTSGVAVIAALSLGACGEAKQAETPPAMSSPRVALTSSYPGFQPFALITYRDAAGRRCHGLGSVTPNGPRVMGALGDHLAEGLRTRGKCLLATDGDVSLQVRKAGHGTPRVVGGIVREGVTRVIVDGQAVHPRAGGAFLIVQPAERELGEVELGYRAGHHKRVPVRRIAS